MLEEIKKRQHEIRIYAGSINSGCTSEESTFRLGQRKKSISPRRQQKSKNMSPSNARGKSAVSSGGRATRSQRDGLSALPDMDSVFSKIYDEFLTLRTCGISRADLVLYIKQKQHKQDITRTCYLLKGVKKTVDYLKQIV